MEAKIYDKIIYRGRNPSIEAEKGCMPCIQNATVQSNSIQTQADLLKVLVFNYFITLSHNKIIARLFFSSLPIIFSAILITLRCRLPLVILSQSISKRFD